MYLTLHSLTVLKVKHGLYDFFLIFAYFIGFVGLENYYFMEAAKKFGLF